MMNFIFIGLVYKKQSMFEEALECFWKLRTIVHYDPQTLYQIGHLYQLMSDVDQAAEWYLFFIKIIALIKMFLSSIILILN